MGIFLGKMHLGDKRISDHIDHIAQHPQVNALIKRTRTFASESAPELLKQSREKIALWIYPQAASKKPATQ